MFQPPLFVGFLASALAASTVANSETLDDAWRVALASAIRFSEAPAFDFSSARLPIALPLFDGTSVTIAETQVAVPLYTGGALGAGLAAALAARTAEEQSHDAVRSASRVTRSTAA
jgi:hypothetical protein